MHQNESGGSVMHRFGAIRPSFNVKVKLGNSYLVDKYSFSKSGTVSASYPAGF